MNIREISQRNPHYYEITREERNYAAIFFAALCKEENASRFLKACGMTEEIGPDFGLYFEYAYLHDLWNAIRSEEIRKEIIKQNLPIQGIEDILQSPVREINQQFGAVEASSEEIQYPGGWSMGKYDQNFPDNKDFLRICRFKWAFNIKPDIVIHLNRDKALCIEAKYESGEGYYPSITEEVAIFERRSIPRVGQMELQKYMMEDLLGIEMDFMFLVSKKQSSETHRIATWAEAFEALDLSGMPAFVTKTVEKIRGTS
ncbi:MAG: hypothetical protein PF508_16450 [Spirochaeta sp.]|jgi:hypothetical protein|nr:hypothetical protein [Spirochaeta sp.]